MAKLYTSALGAKPKKRAKPKKAKKAPVDPFAAPTEAALKIRFEPAEQEIAAERRISDQQVANTGSWYNDYQRSVAAANQNTQAGYRGAQQSVYGQANLSRQQDQTQASQLDQSAQANATLRGATAGANPAAQAAAARQTSNNSFGGLLGAQGAAQNTYGNQMYANAAGMRASELQKEQARRRLVEKKGQDLAKEKGAARLTTRQELEDQAWKTRLEEATFNLKRNDTAADNARLAQGQKQTAKNQALTRKQTAKNQRQIAKDKAAQRRLTQRGQNLTDQRAREKAAKGGKGGAKGGKGKNDAFTPTQKRGNVDKYQKARGLVQSDGKGHSAGHMVKTLVRKGWNPILARAAVQRELYGGVDKKLAQRIKREFGFNVKIRKNSRTVVKKTFPAFPNLGK